MTREDIIQMACEAIIENSPFGSPRYGREICLLPEEIERFYQLAVEKATEAANARSNASWTLMCEKMVKDEREACAVIAETYRTWDDTGMGVASEIRARGQA